MSYIPKIKNNRLGADAVTSDKILDGEVFENDLANDAVTAGKIAEGAVGTSELAGDAVTGDKIADNAIGAEHISTGAVGTDELAGDAVTGDKIADDAVGAEHISTGAVGTDELAADAVTGDKLADNAVGSEHISDGAVGTSELGADAVTGDKLADDAVGAEHISAGAVGNGELADGAVNNAKVAADAAIELSKLETDPLARENHTGSQPASTISDFDDQVRTSRLDQMAKPEGYIDMNFVGLNNLPEWIMSDYEAVHKKYVDDAIVASQQGLDVKKSVRVATQADIDLTEYQGVDLYAETPLMLDGVAMEQNSRVLVKAQDNKSENGIYFFNFDPDASLFNLVRADDATPGGSMNPGMFTFVEEGTNADQGWVLINDRDEIETWMNGGAEVEWEFAQFSNAIIVSTLDSLTDVNTASAESGSMLFYNGTGWVTTGADIKANGAVLEADSLRLKGVASFSTSATLNADTDHVALVDSAGGAITMTLPASPVEGHVFQIKDAGGASETNAITVGGNGNMIDGAATFVIDVNYQNVTMLYSGGAWHVL